MASLLFVLVGTRKPLLTVVIHEPDWVPALLALCAGYEQGEWRRDLFVDEVFNWLPSFVLPWSEQQATLADATAVELIRAAAQRVYETDNYKSRGEFGELILHGVLMQEFGTRAAVSKIWFEDAKNNNAKGFNVVNVSDDGDDELHLWLGEAKFYGNLGAALRSAIDSFIDHMGADYLRSEFALVAPKVDGAAPYAERLLDMLDRSTPLDKIFSVLHLPLLVTYDSAVIGSHTEHGAEYQAAIEEEVQGAWEAFGSEVSIPEVAIHAIFLPLKDKSDFVTRLHERLKTWQQI